MYKKYQTISEFNTEHHAHLCHVNALIISSLFTKHHLLISLCGLWTLPPEHKANTMQENSYKQLTVAPTNTAIVLHNALPQYAKRLQLYLVSYDQRDIKSTGRYKLCSPHCECLRPMPFIMALIQCAAKAEHDRSYAATYSQNFYGTVLTKYKRRQVAYMRIQAYISMVMARRRIRNQDTMRRSCRTAP